jgi:prepilin-type N-terminal cleavage/methylation domain-containing protein
MPAPDCAGFPAGRLLLRSGTPAAKPAVAHAGKEDGDMKAQPTYNTRRGFTLIELLIVVAIIGILAGLLLPAIMMAQEKGRRAQCLNNLSQFGKMIIMYGMDHDGRCPSNLVALAEGGGVIEPESLKCRSDRWRTVAPAITDITEATADTHCSYNLVTRGIDGAPLGSMSAGNTMLACDKDGERGNVTAKGFGGNHGGAGGNVLRMDGAARWVEKANWSSNVWVEADVGSVVGY